MVKLDSVQLDNFRPMLVSTLYTLEAHSNA